MERDEVAFLMGGRDDHDLDLVLDQLLARPSWQRRAACRGDGPGTYVPPRGGTNTAAMETCARCTVRADCLGYALADPDIVGVWGGTTGQQRRAMRRDLRAAG